MTTPSDETKPLTRRLSPSHRTVTVLAVIVVVLLVGVGVVGAAQVLQDFTTSAGRTLGTAWQVLANTSGIIKLLFGLPNVIANQIQLFFQMVFSITFAGFIRGVVLQ